jgi:hypothetical protein
MIVGVPSDIPAEHHAQTLRLDQFSHLIFLSWMLENIPVWDCDIFRVSVCQFTEISPVGIA